MRSEGCPHIRGGLYKGNLSRLTGRAAEGIGGLQVAEPRHTLVTGGPSHVLLTAACASGLITEGPLHSSCLVTPTGNTAGKNITGIMKSYRLPTTNTIEHAQ